MSILANTFGGSALLHLVSIFLLQNVVCLTVILKSNILLTKDIPTSWDYQLAFFILGKEEDL